MNSTNYLTRPDGSRIAYQHVPGKPPGILFCAGFNSDMQGTKAQALDAWCRERGRQFTRFDCFGHGQSSGKVEEGCVGRWRDDALVGITAAPDFTERMRDHRLSGPGDIKRLQDSLERLLQQPG